MKKALVIAALFSLACANSQALDNTEVTSKMLPAGMKASMETIEGKVLKVYTAEENGARFRAYVVQWKGVEVIVSDTLGTTSNKEGDTITFMAQRIEMPRDNGIKTLNFMIMDFSAFMKRKF